MHTNSNIKKLISKQHNHYKPGLTIGIRWTLDGSQFKIRFFNGGQIGNFKDF
uniref:Uncharacterized protein n=1 Tax=Meloidogyne incognita TaxID=6306 RepID=A0A914LZ59_MELIC